MVPQRLHCVHICIFLRRGSTDFPSFLQRSLIAKRSGLELAVTAAAMPLPLPAVPQLLWSCSLHAALGAVVPTPTLEGSRWFPLTSWLWLACSQPCSCALA